LAVILHKQKVIYFPVPKLATTSIKPALYKVETEGRGALDNPHAMYPTQIFPKNANYGWLYTDTEYFVFAIYRDPIERFVSAFRNRIRLQTTRTQVEASGMPQHFDINGFIAHFQDYALTSIEVAHHFAPQVLFLPNAKMHSCRYYALSELDELAHDLSEHLGDEITLQRRNASRGMPEEETRLSQQSLETLVHCYAPDFRRISMIEDKRITLKDGQTVTEGLHSCPPENIFYRALKAERSE